MSDGVDTKQRQRDVWQTDLAVLDDSIRRQIKTACYMRKYTTLRVGGPADLFYSASDRAALSAIVAVAQRCSIPHIIVGDGSNICVSDDGFRGLVIQNRCRMADVGESTLVDAGCNFMQLSISTMQASLSGMEWAVGIPGTVGGALVSNAGAYGGNISDIVESINVIERGEFKTVGPDWMEFSYRDSRLRRDSSRPAALIGVTLKFKPGDRAHIRRTARDIQRQRFMKQPWEPSAGSFFKNIHDPALADSLVDLPDLLKKRGIVTSAYLIDVCGCKGLRIGDAAISPRHANFVVNFGNATANEVRRLVDTVRGRVYEQFGITLEEEVLYIGDWKADYRVSA